MKFDTLLTRHLPWLLLTSTTFACAAESELDAPEVTAREGGGPLSGPGTADPKDELCDPSNQVVVFNTQTAPEAATACPDFVGGSWTGNPIFGGGGVTVPSGLAGYCRYTSAGATTDDVDDLALALQAFSPGAYEIGTDCRAVEPQGSAISDEVGDELDSYFGWLSGRTTPQEIALTVSRTPAEIHTAIVDTYPSNPDTTKLPYSSHGPVVTSIVESFLCPTGVGCIHQVRNYLGLPRTNQGMNTPRGGQVGLQSDLARGIYSALVADQQMGSEHLVINLSVAWEAEEFGGMELSDMDPAARAVFDVIRAARCRGALIIAAAGNQSGLSCAGEPMAPARWEDIPAPDSLECIELGILNPFVDTANFAPLVYAVGGLLGSNTPMATSRRGGMPRLAAASSHAVAHPREGLTDLAVRTGTSIGTAVVSAAASLVWSYDPGLSPSDVMQHLYQSGQPVGSLTADFGPGASVAVHRVDACDAINSMFPGTPLTCESSPPVSLDQIAADVEAAVTDTYIVSNSPGVPCTDGCGENYTLYPVLGSSLTCATVEPDPWRWLTAPQPTQAGCEDCLTTTDHGTNQSTAFLTVSDYYAGWTIKAVSLELYDEKGNRKVFGITEKMLLGGGVEPMAEEISEYVVPMSLGGDVFAYGYVLMAFTNPASGESVETRDALLLRNVF